MSAAVPGTPGTPEAPGGLRGRMGKVAAASALALAFGQLVSLGQTVALARLLSPAEVGLFAAGSVLTAFAGTFVEGGLRSGLVHREGEMDDAAETVFRATLASGLLMTLLTLAAAPVVAAVFDERAAGLVAAAMAGGVLLVALVNVPEALLQREFSVRRRIIVGPSVAVTFAVVSVALAASGLGVWSLVIGSYASTTVWIVLLWWLCDWRPGRGRAGLDMYRQIVRYGAPVAVGSVLAQVSHTVQAVITGRLLGVQALGLLRYGERIAQIPSGVIIEVGANSLFPAFSRLSSDRDRFRDAYLRALRLVVVVGAAMSAALVAVGQPLVVVVLGDEWRGAGTVLVAMAGLGLGTALSTSAEALKGADRTALLNWVTAVDLVLGIALVVVLAPFLGLAGVGLAVTVTVLVTGAMLVMMTRSVLGVGWGPLVAAVVPTVLAAAVTGAAVLALESQVLRSDERSVLVGLGGLVLDGIVFGVLYLVALRVLAPAAYRLLVHTAASQIGALRRRVA